MKSLWLIGMALFAGPARAQSTASYTYDALGRLTGSTIVGVSTGQVVTRIGYDAAGNRVTYKVVKNSSAGAGSPQPLPAGTGNAPSAIVIPINGFTIIPNILP